MRGVGNFVFCTDNVVAGVGLEAEGDSQGQGGARVESCCFHVKADRFLLKQLINQLGPLFGRTNSVIRVLDIPYGLYLRVVDIIKQRGLNLDFSLFTDFRRSAGR